MRLKEQESSGVCVANMPGLGCLEVGSIAVAVDGEGVTFEFVEVVIDEWCEVLDKGPAVSAIGCTDCRYG